MIYLLKADGSTEVYKEPKIGQYFSLSEPRFQEDLKLYGEVTLCEPLFIILNCYRELKGVPVNLNSLNRDRKKQLSLIQSGARAAKVSPHEFALAADIDTVSFDDTIKSVPLLRQASKQMNIPIRIGWQDYMKDNSTFIHLDVCPLYFAKGKVWHNVAHPVAWSVEGLEW